MSGGEMKRRQLTSFFFLVLLNHIRQSVQLQTNSDQLDTVLQNIDNKYRKVWLQDSTMTRAEKNTVSVLTDKPWSLTDPTGVYSPVKASNHNVSKRDLPFIYQSPPTVPCPNAASTSIISGSKAVDFASFSLGILTLVININNNINNNNNNNNNINLNAVDSSNIVANFNTNNANQVNIMPPGGRRKRSLAGSTAWAIVAALQVKECLMNFLNQIKSKPSPLSAEC